MKRPRHTSSTDRPPGRAHRFGAFLRLPRRRPRNADATPDATPDAASMSQLQLIGRAFTRHRLAVAGTSILLLFYAAALGAEFVATQPPVQRNVAAIHCPPTPVRWSFGDGLHCRPLRQVVDPNTLRLTYTDAGGAVPLRLFPRAEPGTRLLGLVPLRHRLFGIDRGDAADESLAAVGGGQVFFPLGSDKYGRCVFSRVVHGARVSLSVGLLGVAMTFVLGTLIGGVSGYLGGRADNAIQRLIEVVNAVPSLPLWIALAAAMPPDWSPLRTYFAITIVLSLLAWTGLARVVRGKILSLREEDYAVAARLLGASHGRVLVRHLLPGFTSHIVVALTLAVPGMILGETVLSFLGLGLRPPVVSWGVMLQDCLDVKAVRFFPWLLLPAAFIVATVLAFNFVGDGLRDAADPYATR